MGALRITTLGYIAAGAVCVVSTAPAVWGLSAVYQTASVPMVFACPCDCNGDGQVTQTEIDYATTIANGQQPLYTCQAADANGDGMVGADDLAACTTAANTTCSQPAPSRPRILPNSLYSQFSETALAERGMTSLVAFNDREGALLQNYCQVYTSTDGAKTFPHHASIYDIGSTQGSPVNLGGPSDDLYQSSDPTLTVGVDGTWYFGSALFNAGFAIDMNCQTEDSYFVVTRSTDGIAWSGLDTIGGWGGIFHDRPWLQADDGFAQVVWATFNGYTTPTCNAPGEPSAAPRTSPARPTVATRGRKSRFCPRERPSTNRT